jgi:hypothetical protein
MKSNEMDLVKIEWLDAMSDDNTWQDLKELKEQKLRPVECVGWILHQDQEKIITISSFDEESQMGGGGTTIPRSCIVRMIQLKETI